MDLDPTDLRAPIAVGRLEMRKGDLAAAAAAFDEAADRYRAALAVAERLAEDGRLEPRDAGLPDDLRRRLAAVAG